MFSSELKFEIAQKVQEILQEIKHSELPSGEIQFFLHVDGAEGWSWANIRNNNPENIMTPMTNLIQNLTVI